MIKVIECFAGIGSQRQALKNIGVEHEVVAISEIDKYCLQSYKAIHGDCPNLGSICDIERLPKADLWTYSFPCQDISVAGNLAGIQKGTRSGLLYEVERLLNVANANDELPKYLLLENVKNLVSKRFKPQFDEWLKFLEGLGYKNYWKILNAKDYGIPQNRERVFCVSVRGDHSPFSFPPKQELKLKLKDLLEDKVDERYYLSQKMINCFMSDGTNGYPRKERFLQNISKGNKEVGNAVTTLAGSRPTDNFIIDEKCFLSDEMIDYIAADNDKWTGNNGKSLVNKTIASTINTGEGTRRCDASNYIAYGYPENTDLKSVLSQKSILCDKLITDGFVTEGDVVDPSFSKSMMENPKTINKTDNSVSPTITTGCANFGVTVKEAIPVKNNTKQGYLLAEDGDAVDISGRMQWHRGTVQKGISQTITCAGGDNVGVVIKDASMYTDLEKQLFTEDGNVKRYIDSDIVDEFKEGQMATTSYCNGYGHGKRTHDESVSLTVTERPSVKYNLRIRKLTSRECLRLMGWDDGAIDKIQASGVSSSQQYKQAGNGIVINVLEAIFREMFLKEDRQMTIYDFGVEDHA